MKRLAVLASGRGSNFRAIIAHERLSVLQGIKVALLVTNDASAGAVTLAKENSIPAVFVDGIFRKKFASREDRERARARFDERVTILLRDYRIDLVALAGFMQVVGPPLLSAYRWRIMNIHPAKDLARFGGRGMFGISVHEAVLKSGERESGCTIHYVDESVDGGPVILQSTVPVEPGDTPETLAHRILVQEHRTYSKAIQLHADERIVVEGRKVLIDWSRNWEESWNRRQEAFIRYQTEQDLLLKASV